ncbi:MAG: Lrp/AsnC family transcriptional regulator [Proteobacteria bacterium]|nr:MAG: Lrp/AsnC family transcriptional regulator [Pseudomonadota bacterium]QKK11486.1 MAG: Lrp/AsnC family transcriptional regulator [Pseudomonadota bacterium]
MPYDRYEANILSILQRDGRITNQALAEQVGLSPAPCWRRLKALEESGIIRRYAAILEPEKVGIGFCVFAHVTITRHSEGIVEQFERAVMNRPEILECYSTMGSSDYLLKIMVADVAAYDAFLHSCLFVLPGVRGVESFASLREIKYDTALPLADSQGSQTTL